jgi:hypothetical protein
MKIILFLLKLLFLTFICSAQTNVWSTHIDTSRFPGIQRNAFIIGTSDNFIRKLPILYVNKTNAEEIRICLAYWPVHIFSKTMFYFSFDNDERIYVVRALYSAFPFKYTLDFDYISREDFLNKLKTANTLYTKLINMNATFTLNGAKEALQIFKL